MTVEQAFGIIAEVCAQHVGTLKDHEMIQQALAVIGEVLEPKAPAQLPQRPQKESTQHGHA